MNNARNVNMNSAISIASFIIRCLYDDDAGYQYALNWLGYYDNLEIAISKWSKPQRKTLLHQYIKDQYLYAQNYILGKYFVVEEIEEMQNLLEHYEVIIQVLEK